MREESEFVPFIPNVISETEKREQQYQNELEEFLTKNNYYGEDPVFDEAYYIKYKIDIFENLISEYEKTADFGAGRILDGKEIINGNLITTKNGTVSDLAAAKNKLTFLLMKKDSFKTAVSNSVQGEELTNEAKALKMYYEGIKDVTRTNYGNSIYNNYTKWMKKENRTANDGTNLQLRNKIQMFEKVISVLDDEFKQKAIDECKILKSYLPKN